MARTIGQLAGAPQTELSSDSLSLPKIAEDGVPVYDSVGCASSNYMILNKIWTIGSPIIVLGIAPQPALAALTYGIFSYIYYVAILR